MSNIKKTTEEFKIEVANLTNNEYSFEDEYVNNKKLSKFKHHNCGTLFEMRPCNFIRNNGNRCPVCCGNKKKTTESFKIEVMNIVGDEYIVLGEYVNNKTSIKMKHVSCGYEWNANPKSFLGGTRCPNCSHGSRLKDDLKFKEEVKTLTNGEYEFRGTYINCKTKTEIYHSKCGNTYLVEPRLFINGKRCPFCANKKLESNGVLKIKNFLDKNHIKYEQEYFFENFVNKSNIPFKFDFYLNDYDLLLEFDGFQHFQPMRFKNEKKQLDKFNRLRETDILRNNYCIENKLRLARISYKDEKEIDNKLYSLLLDESSTTIESSILYIDEEGNSYNMEEYYK